MTINEEKNLLEQANFAYENADWNEFERLMMQIPIPPRMALVGKESFGAEYIRQFNLSDANKQYGAGWLDG